MAKNRGRNRNSKGHFKPPARQRHSGGGGRSKGGKSLWLIAVDVLMLAVGVIMLVKPLRDKAAEWFKKPQA